MAPVARFPRPCSGAGVASASATRSARRRWSSTLVWRSVLTSIRPVPAASASGSSSSELEAVVGELEEGGGAWRRRRRAGSRAGPRTRSPSRAFSWGRKWKIPPPSLSMTTIRTGVVTSRSAASAAEVVEEAEVAGDDRRRPAGRVAGADSGGDQAVEAVGAAVAEEQGVGVDRRQERLLVADRHARGGVDEVAVGVGGAEGRVQARLGQGVEAVELGARSPPAPRPRPRSRPPAARDPRRAAPPTRPRDRSGRPGGSPPPAGSGSFQPPARVDHDLVGPGGGKPGPQRLAGRHLPEPEDEVGDDPGCRSARRAAGGRRR